MSQVTRIAPPLTGVKRIVWLFSMVLGYSRLIWARFVIQQDMQSVLRCHIGALGVPGMVIGLEVKVLRGARW